MKELYVNTHLYAGRAQPSITNVIPIEPPNAKSTNL